MWIPLQQHFMNKKQTKTNRQNTCLRLPSQEKKKIRQKIKEKAAKILILLNEVKTFKSNNTQGVRTLWIIWNYTAHKRILLAAEITKQSYLFNCLAQAILRTANPDSWQKTLIINSDWTSYSGSKTLCTPYAQRQTHGDKKPGMQGGTSIYGGSSLLSNAEHCQVTHH